MGSVRFWATAAGAVIFGAILLSCTNLRSAFEQAIDRRSARASAAPEQPAHVDGRFARRPLRGHSQRRLRHLSSRNTSSRSLCWIRRPARSPIFLTRALGARQADALFGSRFQPRWQAHLCQHGFAHRPDGRGQRCRGQRHRGLQLRRGKDRAGAPDSSAHCSRCRRAARRGCRRSGQRQGVPYPAAIAVIGDAGA